MSVSTSPATGSETAAETGAGTAAAADAPAAVVAMPFAKALNAGLRAAMFAAVPALGAEGLAAYDWAPPKLDAKPKGEGAYPIKDFYLTNSICRASQTMQRCSAELLHGDDMLEAAE